MKKIQIHCNQKQKMLLAVNGILLIGYLVLAIIAHKGTQGLYSQQEADRWEEEKGSYAQVSAFISPNRNMQAEDISAIRSGIMETLSNDSLNQEGNGRTWIDAYSGECEAALRKENNTLNVTAVGVGGDFFQFHPIPLLSGSYISSEDLNDDRIVVDENFAWAMFGSNDIVGMQIWMGNYTYVIAGVTEVSEASLYQTAYGEKNRIYMSYDQLKKQQENLKITCYEAVMPNPISNYAYYALRKACDLEEEDEDTIGKEDNPLDFAEIEIVENTNRYQRLSLFTKLKTLRLRSMRTNSVGYPFWENLARVEEEQQMLLLVVRLLLLVFPCICLVWWLCRLWKQRTWTVKGFVLDRIDAMREKRARAAEEKLRAEEEGEVFADAQDTMSEAAEEDADGEDIEEDKLQENALEDIDEEGSKGASGGEDIENGELHSVTSEDLFSL